MALYIQIYMMTVEHIKEYDLIFLYGHFFAINEDMVRFIRARWVLGALFTMDMNQCNLPYAR